jgi:RNA polymerase sigma-70 factor (ECF subfamily)
MERESTPSDAQCVRHILEGSQEASVLLFRRYGEDLFRFLYFRVGADRAQAEDLTQDVFLDAWRNLDRFDMEREFWPWLLGIAGRRLARHYRSAQASPFIALGRERHLQDILERLESASPLPDQILDRLETRELLGAAFSSLNPKHQKLLELKYFLEKTQEEIAAELDLSIAAVNSSLQRARAALRASLTSHCGGTFSHE